MISLAVKMRKRRFVGKWTIIALHLGPLGWLLLRRRVLFLGLAASLAGSFLRRRRWCLGLAGGRGAVAVGRVLAVTLFESCPSHAGSADVGHVEVGADEIPVDLFRICQGPKVKCQVRTRTVF